MKPLGPVLGTLLLLLLLLLTAGCATPVQCDSKAAPSLPWRQACPAADAGATASRMAARPADIPDAPGLGSRASVCVVPGYRCLARFNRPAPLATKCYCDLETGERRWGTTHPGTAP